MLDRPTLYSRRKGNGAAVYRVGAGEHARMDLLQIAILKQNGEVKAAGKQEPSADELTAIAVWYQARESGQETRDAARVDQLIGDLNAVAQWVQANADDAQIATSAQPILMAMHDLRDTLPRRMAGRGGSDNK